MINGEKVGVGGLHRRDKDGASPVPTIHEPGKRCHPERNIGRKPLVFNEEVPLLSFAKLSRIVT